MEIEGKGSNEMIKRKRSRVGKIGTKAKSLFKKRRKNLKRTATNLNLDVNACDYNQEIGGFNKLNMNRMNGKKFKKRNLTNMKGYERNIHDEDLAYPMMINEDKIKNKLHVDDYIIYEYDHSMSDDVEDIDLLVSNENEGEVNIPQLKGTQKNEIDSENDEMKESYCDDTVFSKIIEEADEDYKNILDTAIHPTNSNSYEIKSNDFQSPNSNLLQKENSKTISNSNRIFKLQKINNKNKLLKFNDYSELVPKEIFLCEDEKMAFQENFSMFNDNLNKTSNINFNIYKPQIKINNYFIKHKSNHLDNSFHDLSDVNNQKRFLTKPCIICEKARFAKNELLKLQTCKEFMLSFKYFIKQAEIKVEQNNMNSTNLQIFLSNKNLFEEYYDKHYKNDPTSLKKNFKRGKRICVDCFEKYIETKPSGANELLELIREEDEQAEIDETKKNEIFREIKKFMYMNGYDVDKSFPIFSNSVDLTEENFNIFNIIFSKKVAEESTANKFTSNFNSISSPNKTMTNFNSNPSKISEVNNTLQNLSNFNDKPKISKDSNLIPSEIAKNKISISNVKSIFNEKNFHPKNENAIGDTLSPTEMLRRQCEFFKNVMTFEQLVMLQIMNSVDDYILKLSMLSRNIQTLINFMSNLIIMYRDNKCRYEKSSLINKDELIPKENLLNRNDTNLKDNSLNEEMKDILIKNLNDNSECKDKISMSHEYDEKSILENLNRLLFLNTKVIHALNMYKTIMNYFSTFLPVFCKNSNIQNINYFCSNNYIDLSGNTNVINNEQKETIPLIIESKNLIQIENECNNLNESETNRKIDIDLNEKGMPQENVNNDNYKFNFLTDNQEGSQIDPLTFPLCPLFPDKAIKEKK